MAKKKSHEKLIYITRRLDVSLKYKITIRVISVVVALILCALVFGFNGIWIGYALSPLLSLIVLFVYIFFRYGRDKIPFIFEKSDTRSFTFDLTLKEDSIISLRDKVESILIEKKINSKK